MKKLLEKIDVLSYKYSLEKDNNSFNIFEILRKIDDEVNLHSRFISELLSPQGRHNMGDVFLLLFLKSIGFIHKSEISTENTRIYYEKYIGEINEDKTEGGRLDLLIENIGDTSIIIENKIYADDQDNQLLRCFNYDPDSHIYYLTLFGKEPSNKSIGKLNREHIHLISYRNEITDWLSRCIEKSADRPILRESIIQYKRLINDLTGNSTSMKERLDIYKLLSENNNIINANKIVQNWIHIKWHTEFDFWKALQYIIEKDNKYKVLERQKYSPDNLNNVIHRTRNKNPWYGITINICDYKGSDVYLVIERGFENMYYGIKTNANDVIRIEIGEKIKEIGFDGTSKYWAGGYKCFREAINFEAFSNEVTLNLCNGDKREIIVKSLYYQLEEFITQCKGLLSEKKSNINSIVCT